MTDDLETLRHEVRHLTDRAEILDCITRHARGCDRHDTDLITGTYHPDGVDEHGTAVNAGPGYAAWANGMHAATSRNHLHHITTHSCEIDGAEAHAESYVLVTLLSPDGATATVMCGRYLDRLERRDGHWKIAVRRSTVELAFTADAALLKSSFFTDQHYATGSRDRTDPSYHHPLDLDTTAPRW
jgi:hypothetical protein